MPRPKGKLDSLDDEQFIKLRDWLLAGMIYEKAVEVIQLEFGIATSTRAVGEFWDTYCEPVFLARRRGAQRLSTVIRQEAEKHPENFTSATVDLLSQLSFDLANAAVRMPTKAFDQQVKDIKTLFTLVQKQQSREDKMKSLEFEKEKFRASLRSKLETAMEALHAEIKDKPAALAAFNQMEAALAK